MEKRLLPAFLAVVPPLRAGFQPRRDESESLRPRAEMQPWQQKLLDTVRFRRQLSGWRRRGPETSAHRGPPCLPAAASRWCTRAHAHTYTHTRTCTHTYHTRTCSPAIASAATGTDGLWLLGEEAAAHTLRVRPGRAEAPLRTRSPSAPRAPGRPCQAPHRPVAILLVPSGGGRPSARQVASGSRRGSGRAQAAGSGQAVEAQEEQGAPGMCGVPVGGRTGLGGQPTVRGRTGTGAGGGGRRQAEPFSE